MPLQQEDLPIVSYGTPILAVLVAANFLDSSGGNGPSGLQVAVAVVTPLVSLHSPPAESGCPGPEGPVGDEIPGRARRSLGAVVAPRRGYSRLRTVVRACGAPPRASGVTPERWPKPACGA